MSRLSGFITDQLPDGWTAKPLWSLFRRVKKTGYPNEELLSVYRDYGVIPKSSRDDNHNKESADLTGYQLVIEGFLVANKMKAWQGSISISRHRGIVSPAYYVYEPLSLECDQFLHYLLRSNPYVALYGRISKGVRVNQWDLEHEALRNVPVTLPDVSTQRAIARFLDHETTRIDRLIDLKQNLIKTLTDARFSTISRAVSIGLDSHDEEVKTTSQYLPIIPGGWRIWRLKHLARVRGGITVGRAVRADEPVVPTPYMRVANVQASRLDLSEIAHIDATQAEIEKYSLLEGDVLMNEGGDNDKLGRGVVWNAPFAPCLNQNHVFAVRSNVREHADWISLATNAQYARDFFYLHSNQSTNLASISKSNLEKFPVAVPPREEMLDILVRVRVILDRFDSLTSKVQSSIDRLREYRAALITAAVTGQIDVATRGRRGEGDRQLDAIQEEMGA